MRNIRVGMKLSAGYATVLLLTVLMAWNGISALDVLSERSSKVDVISRMINDANDIRYSRASFEQTNDTRHVDELRASMVRFKETVRQEQGLSRLKMISTILMSPTARWLSTSSISSNC
jgi:hypothetical protein